MSAVARLVRTRPAAMPLGDVLRLVVANLPLKEDLEEMANVYHTIFYLFQNNSEAV